MGPSEARDLMFAGAGVLWGAVTVFRTVRVSRKEKISSPVFVAVAAAVAISCLGYLVHRL